MSFQMFSQSEKLQPRQFTVEDGLPSNSIFSLLQDTQGYLWIGTEDGLARFDGYEFKTFHALDEGSGISVRRIVQLIEGHDSNIYLAGTLGSKGLERYNPRKKQFELFLGLEGDSVNLPHARIQYLFEDSRRQLWIISEKSETKLLTINRWDHKKEKLYQYTHFQPDIPIDKHLTYYSYGLVPSSHSYNHIPIIEHPSGTIHFGSRKGLQSYQNDNDQFRTINLSQDSLLNVHELTIDPSGTLWIGAEQGLFSLPTHSQSSPNQSIEGKDPTPSKIDPLVSHSLNRVTSNTARFIFPGSQHNIWASLNGEIEVFNLKDKKQQIYYPFDNELYNNAFDRDALGNDKFILCPIQEDSKSDIWFIPIRTNILVKYQREQEDFTFYRLSPNIKNEMIVGSFWDSFNTLWIATKDHGLYQIPSISPPFRYYSQDIFSEHSLPNDTINCIFESSDSTIWVGTNSGLTYFNEQTNNFYSSLKELKQYQNIYVTDICQDKKNNLWISSLNQGLFQLDPSGKLLAHFSSTNSPEMIVSNKISTLHASMNEDELWVGYAVDGASLIRLDDFKATHFKAAINKQDTSLLGHYSIDHIFEDSNGRIWLTTYREGLSRYLRKENRFKQYIGDFNRKAIFNNRPINFIAEGIHQEIFVGPNGTEGLFKWNSALDSFISLPDPRRELRSLNNFYQDQKGYIWTASFLNGLFCIHPDSGIVKRFTQFNGLPHNSFKDPSIIDAVGNIWLPTQKGIVHFNPNHQSFYIYNNHNNYRINSVRANFNRLMLNRNGVRRKARFKGRMAICKRKNGEIWIGSNNGINAFHPQSMFIDSVPPKVSIKNVYIKNAHISPEALWDNHKKAPLVLPYHQNDLTFEFVGIHFANPEKNVYSWKLSNYDSEWSEPNDQRIARYTNLSPGTYIFQIKAANADGTWNIEGANFHFHIKKPWWATPWAYLTYLLLIASIVFGYTRFRTQQLKRKNEHLETLVDERTKEVAIQNEQLAKQTLQLKELDKAKSRFFTNISHEFRTPLTVISGLTSLVSNSFSLPKEVKDNLKIVYRNSQQLLRLVNQVLDLAKLESHTLTVSYVCADVVPYLKYLGESFYSYAESNHVHLSVNSNVNQLLMDYDPDRLKDIISNLISNAIKFTPEEGSVDLTIDQVEVDDIEMLQVVVQDTGIGIAEVDIPHIFDRFYQIADSPTRTYEGTGVGLAFAKELITLLGGSMNVSSIKDKGSTFEVRLPIRKESDWQDTHQLIANMSGEGMIMMPLTDDIQIATSKEGKQVSGEAETKDLPIILIIEDNQDVLAYIKACLEGAFHILTAVNGQQGVDVAIEHIPDIIISDIMMPEKDGYEVCIELKNDSRTSHIPIILLTAKADQTDKVSGLKVGAEAYLIKPFDPEELYIRIQKLIELRKTLQSYYQQYSPSLDEIGRSLDEVHLGVSAKPTKKENAFILKFQKTVKDHLFDTQFSIDSLADEMSMSRTQLFRKIKALTDRSPSSYVRFIRLNLAKELLKNPDLSISEVAYEVGFNDPNYFTRSFVQEFSITPTEYRS